MPGRPGSRPPIREVSESELLEHTPLVHFIVRKMLTRGALRSDLNLEYEELVQLGTIGLWEALRRWEPERGARSTYCASYISGYVLQFQRNSTRATGWVRGKNGGGYRVANVTSLQRELAEDFRLIDALESPADTEDEAHWALEVRAVKERILALRDPFRTVAARCFIDREPVATVGADFGWERGTAHLYARRLRLIVTGAAEPPDDWRAGHTSAEAA